MSSTSKPIIVVIGSSNTDMVVKTSRLPVPGETILGGHFFMNAGGKGANQAVAAARLGGATGLIAKLGDDLFGREAISLFQKEGIDTSFVITDKTNPSGVALITVDDKAENCIVVAPGANAALLPNDLKPAIDTIRAASWILMQLEIPLETIEFVAALAAQHKIPVVLNPAPACALSNELLQSVSIITPNEKEAELLTGIEVVDESSARKAAEALYNKGVQTIIITMGAKGALLYDKQAFTIIPAPVVKAIDTTAAGDVFNGALVTALSEQMEMKEAIRFACEAAAISVTRLGAQASAPYRKELHHTI